MKFWILPSGPHEATLLQNPEKRSFACQSNQLKESMPDFQYTKASVVNNVSVHILLM